MSYPCLFVALSSNENYAVLLGFLLVRSARFSFPLVDILISTGNSQQRRINPCRPKDPVAGVFEVGNSAGYTFQILGQKYVEPTRASLIMCLESVFSVLGGWLLLHQELTLREGIGCVIMFIAILVCQIFGQESGTLPGEDHADQ